VSKPRQLCVCRRCHDYRPVRLTPRGVRNAGDESCCAVSEANPKGHKGGLAVTAALTKHIADRRVSDDWSELILSEPPGIRNTIGAVASGSVVQARRPYADSEATNRAVLLHRLSYATQLTNSA
jgi:hypothetical protein